MDTPPNVGLGHYSGVGKDVLAALIVADSAYYRRAFADAVKEEIGSLLLGVALDDRSRYNAWCYVEERKHIPQMRALMQAYAEAKRELVSREYWIDQVFGYMEVYRQGETLVGARDHLGIVIPDCRYPNEVKALLAKGFLLIDLFRPEAPPLPGALGHHISETALFPWDFPFLILNDARPEQMLALFRAIRRSFAQRGNPPVEQWPNQYSVREGLIHIDMNGVRDKW